MAALIIIAITFITVLLYYNFKNKKFWDKVRKINGKPTLPIIGNAHLIKADIYEIFTDSIQMWKELGCKTFKLEIGSHVAVILSTPECVEVVLKHSTQLSKPIDYEYLHPWLGQGLLTADGAKWKRQRKIITPTFHFKILEQTPDVFNKYSKTLLSVLEPFRGKVIDIYPFATRFALDVICDTAMGKSVNALNNEESEYVKAVHDLTRIVFNRIFSVFKRNQLIFNLTADGKLQKKSLKYVHDFSNRLIRSRREEMKEEIEKVFSSKGNYDISQHIESGQKKYRPFLDLLLLSKLPDGQPLDNATIRDEVDTFIFGGHHTTASAISFILYALSKHPEVQTKAFEEQRMLFDSDKESDATFSDLQAMQYLEIVIKESMRLYPSVPSFARQMNEDILLPDGTEIPSGCVVPIFVFGMHRNGKYFPDPEKFKPERFLEDPTKEFGPFCYIPFSAGPRNCIGQKFAMLKLKSVISKMLRRYEILDAGPKYVVKLAEQITLKSVNGVNIILEDRKY